MAAEARLSDEGKKYFRFIEFDENETLITEIRKHPAGMYIIMLTGALVALALFTIGIFGAVVDMVDIFGDELNGLRPFLVSISLVMIFGTAVAVYIAIFLYKSNVIYLTNEKIAQVVYLSLFNRKISQLSIGDVQDVTVMQKGVLAHYFNFGTLIIETAGEQENYRFSYVPDPYQASKLIVGAHERNLVLHGN